MFHIFRTISIYLFMYLLKKNEGEKKMVLKKYYFDPFV